VLAAPIDFNSWTAESYPSVSGFPNGTWNVSGDGSSVLQTSNGQPTFFYSDFDSQGSAFTGTIRVSGGDDDFIGFALGFQPGDSTSSSADYLLIDWKGGSQSFDFNGSGDGPGGIAPAGLAVSRVIGVPTADEFWQHTDNDLTGSPLGTGLEELQRGATLGATGWAANTTYEFTFDFGTN